MKKKGIGGGGGRCKRCGRIFGVLFKSSEYGGLWWSHMYIISLEIDFMTLKHPNNMHHSSCFMKNMKTFKLYDVI